MPPIKIKHVVSFSSEDSAHPADNMLKAETFRKWKSAKPGEAQVTMVLELEKATKISSVDIGNNGSAFVEVLVGSSTWNSTEDYKVLLVMSSFMSPADSKTGNNAGRVRMFGPDKLNKSVMDQKWDRVKLVCTQPFNKNEAYGLSFVKFNSPDEPTEEKQAPTTPKLTKIGSFTLRDESEPAMKAGGLFFKRMSTSPPAAAPPPATQSMAAQVRAASTAAAASITSASSTTVSRDRAEFARADPPKLTPDRTPNNNQASRRTSESSKRKHEASKMDLKAADTGKLSKAAENRADSPPLKKAKTARKTEDKAPPVPFREIMKGVVFVLSGFKNPGRAQLREMAMEMGAKYRPDWEPGCTHLVCAFPNTPKYNQVKGKGTIVSKAWIAESHKNKRKMPAKRYRLSSGSDSSSSDESSEEEYVPQKPKRTPPSPQKQQKEEEKKPSKAPVATVVKSPEKPKPKSPRKEEMSAPANPTEDDDIYGGTTDEDEKEESSDPDTEDELDKQAQKEDKVEEFSPEDEDDKERDAEEQDDDDNSQGTDELPALPDFFEGKKFLFYGEFPEAARRLLKRYIIAYKGELEDYMCDDIDYVITEEEWDRQFDEALGENTSLSFVRPKWVHKCHEMGKVVPFQPYIVVPK